MSISLSVDIPLLLRRLFLRDHSRRSRQLRVQEVDFAQRIYVFMRVMDFSLLSYIPAIP